MIVVFILFAKVHKSQEINSLFGENLKIIVYWLGEIQ